MAHNGNAVQALSSVMPTSGFSTSLSVNLQGALGTVREAEVLADSIAYRLGGAEGAVAGGRPDIKNSESPIISTLVEELTYTVNRLMERLNTINNGL